MFNNLSLISLSWNRRIKISKVYLRFTNLKILIRNIYGLYESFRIYNESSKINISNINIRKATIQAKSAKLKP